jgi:hypothetical protein
MDNLQNIESSDAACAGSDTSHQSKQPKNRQGDRRTDTADGDNACQECAECLIGRLGLGLEHRIQGIDKERSDACRDTKGNAVNSYLPKVRTALRRRAQGNPCARDLLGGHAGTVSHSHLRRQQKDECQAQRKHRG